MMLTLWVEMLQLAIKMAEDAQPEIERRLRQNGGGQNQGDQAA